MNREYDLEGIAKSAMEKNTPPPEEEEAPTDGAAPVPEGSIEGEGGFIYTPIDENTIEVTGPDGRKAVAKKDDPQTGEVFELIQAEIMAKTEAPAEEGPPPEGEPPPEAA